MAVDLLHNARRPVYVLRPIACSGLVAIVLSAVLIVIAPLAHSSPPDPSWLAGGLYDDGDHDDAVLAITATSAVLAAVGVAVSRANPSDPCATRAAPAKLLAGARISAVYRSPPLR